MGGLYKFEIAHAEGFPLELGRSPKKVQNAYSKTILTALRERPAEQDPPRIKRLIGFKNLWRLRVSDTYRLVYQVDHQQSLVTILMLDHRGKVYDRLGVDVDGQRSTRIVTEAPELLEPEPTPEEKGDALIEEKRLDEAYAEYEMALELKPNYPKSLYGQGKVYKEKGDLEMMMEKMDLVIKYGADNQKMAKTIKMANPARPSVT